MKYREQEKRFAANREICKRLGEGTRRDTVAYVGVVQSVYAEFGLKHPCLGNVR